MVLMTRGTPRNLFVVCVRGMSGATSAGTSLNSVENKKFSIFRSTTTQNSPSFERLSLMLFFYHQKKLQKKHQATLAES